MPFIASKAALFVIVLSSNKPLLEDISAPVGALSFMNVFPIMFAVDDPYVNIAPPSVLASFSMNVDSSTVTELSL